MNDPILDALLTPAYPVGYTFWITHFRDIEAAARTWYREANGHDPADSDVAHGLWRALNEGDRWRTLHGAFQDTWPKPGDTPVPEPTPTLPNGGETGRLVARDRALWREDGSLYAMIGATDF